MSRAHVRTKLNCNRHAINVVEMLEMLNEIHEEARGDVALQPLARSVGSAIRVLTELRQTARAVLIEVESEAGRTIRAN